MSAIDYIHLASLVIAAVAGIFTLWRMRIGPTILDRVVASDVLTAVAITFVAVLIVWWARSDLALVLILLALTGFITSVVAARFVTREVVGERRILSREEAAIQQQARQAIEEEALDEAEQEAEQW
ncbi:monovalent cation/H+ antiporter complex subunit F [Schaalia suimastitidis]|uniref:monovalent cation/H+ antiporter complex subunit F n=1 Tax=Schaalia suimastitidis TaxID=121163 RepID=UPI0004048492|nr:monovalent cation/H+ antiporter complex subunit F [Schaalia suimastitidis]